MLQSHLVDHTHKECLSTLHGFHSTCKDPYIYIYMCGWVCVHACECMCACAWMHVCMLESHIINIVCCIICGLLVPNLEIFAWPVTYLCYTYCMFCVGCLFLIWKFFLTSDFFILLLLNSNCIGIFKCSVCTLSFEQLRPCLIRLDVQYTTSGSSYCCIYKNCHGQNKLTNKYCLTVIVTSRLILHDVMMLLSTLKILQAKVC